MDYYQYRRPSDASDTAIDAVTEAGKIIDPAPILCLLLEPRSLVITHGDLYTEHLHGITGANQDVFIASSNSYSDRQKASWEQDNVQVVCAQDLANRELLGETILRDKLMRLAIPVAERGEEPQIGDAVELERRTRTSLTCRVVEKTAAAAGKLLRLR
ncbi:hypothetical protein FRC12_000267 [Ceratobasidium sp. 428]|nr:hypothetical protein FRC12_000267 [Ceratobasidium sp. 428]